MDYKYIEQLMERYWNAETTLEEESILRSFFRQENIPAEMEPLRALFTDEASSEVLDDDFDARMLEMIREEEAPKAVKARSLDAPLQGCCRCRYHPDDWWCSASTLGQQLEYTARLCTHPARP